MPAVVFQQLLPLSYSIISQKSNIKLKQLLVSCSIHKDDERKIVYYRHFGIIGKDNITEAWNKVLSLLRCQIESCDLIIDFREAQFIFNTYQIDEIVNYFFSSIRLLHGRRIAGIVNHTHESAIIKMIETFISGDVYFYLQLFRDTESAYSYLRYNSLLCT